LPISGANEPTLIRRLASGRKRNIKPLKGQRLPLVPCWMRRRAPVREANSTESSEYYPQYTVPSLGNHKARRHAVRRQDPLELPGVLGTDGSSFAWKNQNCRWIYFWRPVGSKKLPQPNAVEATRQLDTESLKSLAVEQERVSRKPLRCVSREATSLEATARKKRLAEESEYPTPSSKRVAKNETRSSKATLRSNKCRRVDASGRETI
jgi:hypothetical protein